jgi:hypothetical protein
MLQRCSSLVALPSGLLELLAASVRNLLVGGAHLGRVDLAAAELALGAGEGWIDVSWGNSKADSRKRTLVNVVLVSRRLVRARARTLATTELGSETRELIHDVEV